MLLSSHWRCWASGAVTCGPKTSTTRAFECSPRLAIFKLGENWPRLFLRINEVDVSLGHSSRGTNLKACRHLECIGSSATSSLESSSSRSQSHCPGEYKRNREMEEGTHGFQPELDAMSFASSTDTLRDTVLMLMRRETCTTRDGQGLTHNAARAAISVQPRAINNERDELNESRPPCSIIMQIFGAV